MNELTQLEMTLVDLDIIELDEDVSTWKDENGMLHVRLYRNKQFYYGHGKDIESTCKSLKSKL